LGRIGILRIIGELTVQRQAHMPTTPATISPDYAPEMSKKASMDV
jgi:hypothetical protein